MAALSLLKSMLRRYLRNEVDVIEAVQQTALQATARRDQFRAEAFNTFSETGSIYTSFGDSYYLDKFLINTFVQKYSCDSAALQVIYIVNPADGSKTQIGQHKITKHFVETSNGSEVRTCVDGVCNTATHP